MKLARITVAALLAVLMFQPDAILAQSTAGTSATERWRAVANLQPGSDLVVKLKTGTTKKANFISANDDSLTLSEKDQVVTLPRDTVARIHLVVTRKSATSERVGAGVGAAFGAGLALSASENGDVSGWGVVVTALIFSAIGFALGRLFNSEVKRVLIFDGK